jgi:hypothetical protein
LLTLSQHQPYSEALKLPCDFVLEIIENQLDESISYLEDDKPRLARKQIAVEKEFGSVQSFVREVLKEKHQKPGRATL